MAASPAWGDLPLLVVGEILFRLPSITDRVRFAAVCRRWKAAAEAEAARLPDREELVRLIYLAEAEAEAMAKARGALPRVAPMAQGTLDPTLSDAGAGADADADADAAPPRPWVEILGRLVAHAEGMGAEAVDGEEGKATTLRMAREVVHLLSHAEADEAPTDEAEVAALRMARKLLDRLLSHAAATDAGPEEVKEDAELEALRMLRVVLRRLISLAEAKQASAGAPPWAELPLDVVGEILIRLPLLADYFECSVLCVNWYHASLEHPYLLPQLFLMTTIDKPAMFSLVDETTRMVTGFPNFARSARLVSSFSGGWVAAALDQLRENVLLRFDTKHPIDLPDRCQRQRLPHLLVHAVALSTCPAADGSSGYMAAAIITGDYPIAFWRPGIGQWVPLVLDDWKPNEPVEGLIYFSSDLHNGFYLLHGHEELVALVPEDGHDGGPVRSSDDPFGVRLVKYVFYAAAQQMAQHDPTECIVACYLVVSRGQLLMVRRYASPGQHTTSFEIFSMEGQHALGPDLVGATWRRCPVLTGRLLFLARGCSVAMETGFSDRQSNIYILNDTLSFRDLELVLDDKMMYACYDIGMMRYMGDVVHLYAPEAHQADRSPWLWHYP